LFHFSVELSIADETPPKTNEFVAVPHPPAEYLLVLIGDDVFYVSTIGD